ncbi:50S ribosomal protein L18 [Thermoclostridium stercorarium subsp. stercorarium DSM 8532]|jgi:large subunit ribosomal protein L18|uniref:Large ribosomal subunit protein uL18 n=3 Tax=Thermoclostridium stercorarium TaxID=1510 RepID=L7VSI5_THES1|nr:50S ribosomal protein L18 [Thermoclostridium stercorarium]AGC69579.1 50S ribosomal protein L18 [Thermoclostridium stercorarium subsp. stercorarium DSM 8532]AGI40530.1 ribosomal protein L18P [Thermoclostridium stercorarium subsp. stercorarium DSM 8532]ANW99809.1 50S ribosomal protein L18 [Thermoclostridium stercorarium subsp. thermolacticum DSM 2910]ANX02436.1 50S ribosomal protein L18 [Thermoclostridium stercorarium subsp. leptospartum DSM 9219]UZQ85519.1 50S ribosomal protein L18 [Thermocl
MIKFQDKNEVRKKKHLRIRKKIKGTAEKPRLCVYRSLKHIYAQIIDDESGRTLVAASTLDEALRGKLEHTGNKAAAREVGKLIGQRAIEKGIKKVVFDRGGYLYHGRVQELADGAREAGLEF